MTQANASASSKRGEPRPWSIALKKSDSRLEIDIHDVIGSDFFGEGVTAKDVLAQLKEAGDVDEIEVRINSLGGYLHEGKAIYNLLRERSASGAKVTVKVDGLAASAASVVAMAGDSIAMPSNAFIMIHEGWTITVGRAEDFTKRAELLVRENRQMAEIYSAASARRSKGKSVDEFLAAMAEETYFDAKEAVEWGLADTIVEDVKVAAAAVDISELASAPEALRLAPYVARAQASEPKPAPAPVPIQLPTAAAAEAAPAALPIPPAPVARNNNPETTGKEKPMADNETKTNYGSVIAALNLIAGATETDILARIGRLREIETQALALTGVTDSAQLVGGLRGMKERADAADKASAELAQVKAERDKGRFETLIAKGQTERKLTPAEAKHYTERFTAAVAEGRGAEYLAEVEGYLAVAPRKFAEPHVQPATARGPGNTVSSATTWNGKTYGELTPMEKHRLSADEPELFSQMRAEHQQRVA